jgi:hypothetical protein
MGNVSTSGFIATLQKAVSALGTNLGGKTLVLAEKVWKEKDLAQEIQSVIDALNAVEPARAAWVKAAADAKSAKASIVPIMLALRAYIQGVYGTSSTVYGEFGFAPRKQGKPTAATIAVRVLKNLATRKARMTMGKNQKQQIKGVVTSSDVAAAMPAAPAPAPAIQPTAPAAPSNVPGNGNGGGSNGAH